MFLVVGCRLLFVVSRLLVVERGLSFLTCCFRLSVVSGCLLSCVVCCCLLRVGVR